MKKLELPEDNEKNSLDSIQKLTDNYIKKIDSVVAEKIKEIMTI